MTISRAASYLPPAPPSLPSSPPLFMGFSDPHLLLTSELPPQPLQLGLTPPNPQLSKSLLFPPPLPQ